MVSSGSLQEINVHTKNPGSIVKSDEENREKSNGEENQ
jgi:hypothetical protein